MRHTARARVGVISALLACVLLSGCEKEASNQQPGAQAPPPSVGVAVVKTESVVLTKELPGRVSAFRVAEIRPQVSGLIQSRLFTEGTDVEAGQVLYQIDPAPFQAELDNAEANLAVAHKTIARLQASLEASKASIKQHQATLNFARKNRQRFEELVVTGAVSATERDQAITEDEVAEAALRSAEAQVRRDREAIAEAEAAIQQAEAVVKNARINLEYTQVNAPISGRIGRSNVTEGAVVTAYQAIPLSTIQQVDPVYVDVPQSTTELLRLRQRLENNEINREGVDFNKVKIHFEEDSNYSLEGTLQFRDITVEPTTGSVVLRITVPNPDGLLLPGMFVRGVIVEGINENAILVTQNAVSRDPKGNPYVLIVDSEDTVQQKMLTVDRSLGDRWLVTSGLNSGERIIIEGIQKVRPGSKVTASVVTDDGPQTKTAQSESN